MHTDRILRYSVVRYSIFKCHERLRSKRNEYRNAEIEESNSFNQRKARNTKDDGSTCREMPMVIYMGSTHLSELAKYLFVFVTILFTSLILLSEK